MKAYIASPFFNPRQLEQVEKIKRLLVELKIDFFSPKDEIVCPSISDKKTRTKVFNSNCVGIENSDFIIANTDNKDPGTLWESGYGFAKLKPIIFFCEGLNGQFNLMLSESGIAVATNYDELTIHLIGLKNNPDYYCEYKGDIE